jgi:metal-responsive CopG/Arc/MetJ family transcriptional regulator
MDADARIVGDMRVPLSIPDDLFEEADAAAKQMNVSRSNLYAIALTEYLRKLEIGTDTDGLNEAHSRRNEPLSGA